MKPKRYLSAVFLLGALLAVASCAGDRTATGPDLAPPNLDLTDGLLKRTGLLDCSPLPYASATKTIGPDGGTIVVGPHKFVVPEGALPAPVTITAEAPTSSRRVVEFAPEGLRFRKPASLTMSYEGCTLIGSLLPRIAYVDGLNILYYLPSFPDANTETVTGMLQHFSQYAVAW
jgi:hypothetical protein